jgi:hypothetical protein
MTWVIATAFVFFGAMVGDVRVCAVWGDGRVVPYTTVGLRKVHPFSKRTLCGFAGDIRRAESAVGDFNAYCRAHGLDGPLVVERGATLEDQLKAWSNDLYRRSHPLTNPATYATELVAVRTYWQPVIEMVVSMGVHVSLPTNADPAVRVDRFSSPIKDIGSGSGIAVYSSVLAREEKELPGLVSFATQFADHRPLAQIMATGLSNAIARAPETTVSPDVDICLVAAGDGASGSLRRTNPPIHVCQTVKEFEEHSASEGDARAVALIG